MAHVDALGLCVAASRQQRRRQQDTCPDHVVLREKSGAAAGQAISAAISQAAVAPGPSLSGVAVKKAAWPLAMAAMSGWTFDETPEQ
jgi:hypothetical protein